jgi:hypothetical protein
LQPSDKLEDGSVSFLDIISLKHGFNYIERLGGIHKVQAHVTSLTSWLYEALSKLKHSNGRPMLRIFGKHAHPNAAEVCHGLEASTQIWGLLIASWLLVCLIALLACVHMSQFYVGHCFQSRFPSLGHACV